MADKEYASIGAKLREEADKALHRALLFAVILALAHLLDIKPSEIDAGGLKIAFRDSSVVYGALALIFWYCLFRALSRSFAADYFLPVASKRLRVRRALKTAQTVAYTDKARRKDPRNRIPRSIKSTAKTYLIMVDIILFPYQLVSSLFGVAGAIFGVVDIYRLGRYVWVHSAMVADGWNAFNA